MKRAAYLDLTTGAPRWVPIALPVVGDTDVLVEIHYIGVNRGEVALLDRSHVPVGGAPQVPGLECAGLVTALGPQVRGLTVGQPVACLVYGGAYATHLVTDQVNVFAVPDPVPMARAAASLEAAVTAWEAVVRRAGAGPGEVVLIMGAAGSVGLAATAVADRVGALPVGVCGAPWKVAACRDAGAAAVVVGYETAALRECVEELGRPGADVVLEVRGGDSVASDLEVLAPEGRIVLLGRLQGSLVQFDLASLNRKRATIKGFNIKQRSVPERQELFDEIRLRVWPAALTEGWLRLPYQVDCACRAWSVHDEIRGRRRVGSSVLRVTGWCGDDGCVGRPDDAYLAALTPVWPR